MYSINETKNVSASTIEWNHIQTEKTIPFFILILKNKIIKYSLMWLWHLDVLLFRFTDLNILKKIATS